MTRPSLNILRPTTYQGGSVDQSRYTKPSGVRGSAAAGATGPLSIYRNLAKPAVVGDSWTCNLYCLPYCVAAANEVDAVACALCIANC
jgi:hypothetical protein